MGAKDGRTRTKSRQSKAKAKAKITATETVEKEERRRVQERVGDLIRKATLTTGELIIPKELLTYATTNVDKIRKESLQVIVKEMSKKIDWLISNHKIRFTAEVEFVPKKKKDK